MSYQPKICPICGESFIPKSSKQKYCKKEIKKICPVCGAEYIVLCQPDTENPVTCSKVECRRFAAKVGEKRKTKICRVCGQAFHPQSSRQMDCNKPVEKRCEVCGKIYKGRCSMNDLSTTCSLKCQQKLATQNRVKSYQKETRICELCGKKFHPKSNTQKICDNIHHRNCAVCGKPFVLDTSKLRADWPKTCSHECAVKYRFRNGNPMSKPEAIQKNIETKRMKYGDNFGSIIWKRSMKTYEDRTGFKHLIINPEVRSRIAKSAKSSSLESRISVALCNYGVKYVHHHSIIKGELSHEFDFYLPEYKMLIDADGAYYHAYLDDPNGTTVNDYWDDIRMYLVPEDHEFYLIIEESEEKSIKKLFSILQQKDENLFDYDSYLYKWCKSIPFPYPKYTDKRLGKEWKRLCEYHNDRYVQQCRIGESIVKHFHPSIYTSHVRNYPSPVEGWNNDNILKKVIKNRLIYVNDIDPSKILKGFNVSKLCPVVSIFNPILAKYVTQKYLSDYSTVFDPFSGFSGRMLGVISCGKQYVGSDIRDEVIVETNNIIQFLDIHSADVFQSDVLTSIEKQYECMLTCPPYGLKEEYGQESTFNSCDHWIDICIEKFKCKRYCFIVDTTSKYQSNVVEEFNSTSHFATVKEKLVIIDQ